MATAGEIHTKYMTAAGEACLAYMDRSFMRYLVQKVCARCGLTKHVDDFHRVSRKVGCDRRQRCCKACDAERRRERDAAASNGDNLKIRATRMLRKAKERAKEKDQPFDLDVQWLLPRLERGCCEATGARFDFQTFPPGSKRFFNPLSPSIDRLDSNLGYLKSNCQVVCFKHNAAKSESSEVQHINYCKAFLKKQGYSVRRK